MKLKIGPIDKIPTKYGTDLRINKVGLYDDDGKFQKWIKLDDTLIDILQTNYIETGDNI